MAELENSCCSPAAQATCCEPTDKASCCGDPRGDSCGCAAGAPAAAADADVVREAVRARYAAAAVAVAEGGGGCCSPADQTGVFGPTLYGQKKAEGATIIRARKPNNVDH